MGEKSLLFWQGLYGLGEAATQPVSPGFNGSERATRDHTICRTVTMDC